MSSSSSEPSVFQIASTHLVTIDIGEPVAKAHEILTTRNIRHLLVTRDALAIGVLSNRDVMRAMNERIEDFHHVRVRQQTFEGDIRVGDVMGWPVQSVDEGASVTFLVDHMLQHKVSSLLVTREGAGVVGIVTTDDLLMVLKKILTTDKGAKVDGEHPWLAEVYNSPIGTILGMLSNSGI